MIEIESSQLLSCIHACYLPRLSSDSDVGDHQAQYGAHQNSLHDRIGILLRHLAATDLSCYSEEIKVDILSAIFGLTHELRSKGPWSPEGFENYAQTIEEAFAATNNVTLNYFVINTDQYRQAIFDTYVANIHKKLTVNDWKKYPAVVKAYCNFLDNIQVHHNRIELDPLKILPAVLHLIDDFNADNILNGLKSCLPVLKCLDQNSFKNSNYQQVIYEILRKVIHRQELDILGSSFSCIAQLIPLFPSAAMDKERNQFDRLLKDMTEDIYMQTNLCKKAICFEFLTKLITIRGVNSVRCKTSFILIIYDNLELCSSDNVRHILLSNVLQALKVWLEYCWIVWNYDSDKKIVALLLKLMYILCNDKASKNEIDELEAIIICTIMLCTKEQQAIILNALKCEQLTIVNEAYKDRLVCIQHSV